MTEPPTCGIGPCLAPRAPGSMYCVGHTGKAVGSAPDGPPFAKRSSVGKQVVISLIVMALAVAGAYWLSQRGGNSSSGAPGGASHAPRLHVPPAAPTTHQIVYYLRGSAHGADLTLTTSSGGQSQQQNVAIPLTNRSGTPGIRFTASDGDFLYISAQDNGSGTMTCTITEDGLQIAHSTSRGRFAIVTCSATA